MGMGILLLKLLRLVLVLERFRCWNICNDFFGVRIFERKFLICDRQLVFSLYFTQSVLLWTD